MRKASKTLVLSHGLRALTIALVGLFLSAASSPVLADPAAPLILTGADLNGSTDPWLPDIPSATWLPLSITVPINNTYVVTGNTVDSVSVTVMEGSSLAVTFPKNRVPDVVYALSGAEVSMNDYLTIEWPNIHDYPVGESHLVYAYDPAIDRWTVSGAATVSADGSALVQVNNIDNTTLSYYFVNDNVLLTLPN